MIFSLEMSSVSHNYNAGTQNLDRINNSLHHSHGALLHVGASYIERNTDVKFVRHRFAFNQTELADVVAVVRSVDEVGVVQLARLHQHVVHLHITT